MLKIKDNVDLKELEKFGLEKKQGFYEYEKEQEKGFIFIGSHTNIVFCMTSNSGMSGDILYDLIQTGLVEKIEGTKPK